MVPSSVVNHLGVIENPTRASRTMPSLRRHCDRWTSCEGSERMRRVGNANTSQPIASGQSFVREHHGDNAVMRNRSGRRETACVRNARILWNANAMVRPLAVESIGGEASNLASKRGGAFRIRKLYEIAVHVPLSVSLPVHHVERTHGVLVRRSDDTARAPIDIPRQERRRRLRRRWCWRWCAGRNSALTWLDGRDRVRVDDGTAPSVVYTFDSAAVLSANEDVSGTVVMGDAVRFACGASIRVGDAGGEREIVFCDVTVFEIGVVEPRPARTTTSSSRSRSRIESDDQKVRHSFRRITLYSYEPFPVMSH